MTRYDEEYGKFSQAIDHLGFRDVVCTRQDVDRLHLQIISAAGQNKITQKQKKMLLSKLERYRKGV